MPYDRNRHHRRSIRLRGYDYAQAGAYFITLVAAGRECLFGEVVDGVAHLSAWGQIAREEWDRTAVLRPYVSLDAFMIMPNHVHGIVVIEPPPDDSVGAQRRCAPTPTADSIPDHEPPQAFGQLAARSLAAIVRAYKSSVTYRINTLRDTEGAPVWQRNYYEHIIRNERDLNAIRDYIEANPMNWERDTENPLSKR
jgi:REP element-mobilizing transposase RayT